MIKKAPFVAAFLGFALLTVFAAGSVQAKSPNDAKSPPSNDAKAVYKHLKTEGYSPNFDDDGDVYFKKEGKTYFVIFDSEDSEYFKIVLPFFWEIESPSEWKKAVRAARKVADTVKVATILLPVDYDEDDDVEASCCVELFCDDVEALIAVFDRSLSAISVAVLTFKEEMER